MEKLYTKAMGVTFNLVRGLAHSSWFYTFMCLQFHQHIECAYMLFLMGCLSLPLSVSSQAVFPVCLYDGLWLILTFSNCPSKLILLNNIFFCRYLIGTPCCNFLWHWCNCLCSGIGTFCCYAVVSLPPGLKFIHFPCKPLEEFFFSFLLRKVGLTLQNRCKSYADTFSGSPSTWENWCCCLWWILDRMGCAIWYTCWHFIIISDAIRQKSLRFASSEHRLWWKRVCI